MRTIMLNTTGNQISTLTDNCQRQLKAAYEAMAKALSPEHALMRTISNTSPQTEVRTAIGYLTQWGLGDGEPHAYNTVHIHISDEDASRPQITASYHATSEAKAGYVLVAIWHGTYWGFHS